MRTTAAVRGIFAAGLIALLAGQSAPSAARPLASGPATGQSEPVTTIEADAMTGQGWLQKLACIGCIGAILAAGGSSIAGLVLVAAMYPEAVALCGFACAVAFS
jgi:hypothetical protein